MLRSTRHACALGGAMACCVLLPANARSAQIAFANLRVCAYEHFSIAQNRCTLDQRQATLVSTRFVCSLDVVTTRTIELRMQWVYRGHPLAAFRRVYHPGIWPVWVKLDTGQPDGPLPGGSLRCTFSAGAQRLAASFTSGGPTGEVVDIDICSGHDAFRYAGFPVCQRDESHSLTAPTSVVCTGIYPVATGKTARIDFLAADGTVITSAMPFKISDPLSQGQRVANNGTLAPGSYRCRFMLDGRVVATKRFEVSSP